MEHAVERAAGGLEEQRGLELDGCGGNGGWRGQRVLLWREGGGERARPKGIKVIGSAKALSTVERRATHG